MIRLIQQKHQSAVKPCALAAGTVLVREGTLEECASSHGRSGFFRCGFNVWQYLVRVHEDNLRIFRPGDVDYQRGRFRHSACCSDTGAVVLLN